MYIQWFDDHPEELLAIALQSGFKAEEASAARQRLREMLVRLPEKSKFDDLGVVMIMTRIVDDIELACRDLDITIPGGVVFGTSRLVGLVASQLRVMSTDVSIIEITIPFIIFCNLISKVLAHTLPHELSGNSVSISFDEAKVFSRLQSNRWIIEEWQRVLLPYAKEGKPPPGSGLAPEGATISTQFLILEAMEVFSIAHEFGHHVLKHGMTASSVEQPSSFDEEHEADLFARIASIGVARVHQEKPGHFLFSGAGGAIILGALELVARARAVLETGQDTLPSRKHHPPVSERIEAFDKLDKDYLGARAQEFVVFRSSLLSVLDLVWEAVKPMFERQHREGVRPVSASSSPLDWLPFE